MHSQQQDSQIKGILQIRKNVFIIFSDNGQRTVLSQTVLSQKITLLYPS